MSSEVRALMFIITEMGSSLSRLFVFVMAHPGFPG